MGKMLVAIMEEALLGMFQFIIPLSQVPFSIQVEVLKQFAPDHQYPVQMLHLHLHQTEHWV
jgi:hypothetical protein